MPWDSSGTRWLEGVPTDWLAHPALYYSGGDPRAPCRGPWHWICPHVQDQLQSGWHSLDLLAESAWETGRKKRHPDPEMSRTIFWLRLEEEVHRLSCRYVHTQTWHALVHVGPRMREGKVGGPGGISRLLRKLKGYILLLQFKREGPWKAW